MLFRSLGVGRWRWGRGSQVPAGGGRCRAPRRIPWVGDAPPRRLPHAGYPDGIPGGWWGGRRAERGHSGSAAARAGQLLRERGIFICAVARLD